MSKRTIEGEAMAELVGEEKIETRFKRWFGPVPDPFDERDRGEVAHEAFLVGARSFREELGVVRVVEIAGTCLIGTPEDIVADVDLEKGAILVRVKEKPCNS